MFSKKWIWVLSLCTGSLASQASHSLAASLTYNLNFLDISSNLVGTGSFSSDPTISQNFTLNRLASSYGAPPDIITVTGIVNPFSATINGVNFQYPSYGGNIWWNPTDVNSTHQLRPISNYFCCQGPESYVDNSWVIAESQGGSFFSGRILSMSGGAINPNSLWGGNFRLSGSSGGNQYLNTYGTWTASLQNSSPKVPELAEELMDLMGGFVLIGGVLGAKRLKKFRA